MEIRVGGTNLANAVLLHQGGGVKVMEQAARDARIIGGQLTKGLRVSSRLSQKAKRWGGAQRLNETPGAGERQGAGKDGAVCAHTEKLIHNRPSDEPQLVARAPLVDQT